MANGNVSENRRAEYDSLRHEILESDKTCITIMGLLLTATGAAGSAFLGNFPPFVGWMLSPIWLVGFIYFTEKRFVIKRSYLYIRNNIETHEAGLQWETFRQDLAKAKRIRPAFPFSPYHMEAIACGAVIFSVPFLGVLINRWSYDSLYFSSSLIIAILFLILSIRAVIIYNNYEVPAAPKRKAG